MLNFGLSPLAPSVITLLTHSYTWYSCCCSLQPEGVTFPVAPAAPSSCSAKLVSAKTERELGKSPLTLWWCCVTLTEEICGAVRVQLTLWWHVTATAGGLILARQNTYCNPALGFHVHVCITQPRAPSVVLQIPLFNLERLEHRPCNVI